MSGLVGSKYPQFFYPAHYIGAFVRYHTCLVKIIGMRWDAVHLEFQYFIQANLGFLGKAEGVWVSERSVKCAKTKLTCWK